METRTKMRTGFWTASIVVLVTIAFLVRGRESPQEHAPQVGLESVVALPNPPGPHDPNESLFGSWGDWMDEGDILAMQVGPLAAVLDNYQYGLRLTRQERASSSDVWEFTAQDYETSYKVIGAQTLWAQDLFVYGVADNGDTVIEQWNIPDEEGGYSVSFVAPSTGIGQAAPPTPGRTVTVPGGVFTPLSNRAGLGRLNRTELYRGSMPTMWDATYDLDGRFAMFIGADLPGLYAVETGQANPAPIALWTTAEMPELQFADSLVVMQHVVNGRAYVLDVSPPSGPETHAIVWDYDNDGFPDDYLTVPSEDFEVMFPDSVWDHSVLPWMQDPLFD